MVRNEAEAEQVRAIFERYLELGSVSALEARLAADGVRSKVWVSARGTRSGVVPLSRGPLFHMLRNSIYLGEIVPAETSVVGCHPPIIEPEVFARVQARIAANTRTHKDRPLRSAQPPAGRLESVRRVEVLPQELHIALEAKRLRRDVRSLLVPYDVHGDRGGAGPTGWPIQRRALGYDGK